MIPAFDLVGEDTPTVQVDELDDEGNASSSGIAKAASGAFTKMPEGSQWVDITHAMKWAPPLEDGYRARYWCGT